MRAVIFDFDYTLADATRGIVDCFRHAQESIGFPPPAEEDIIRTVGYPLEVMHEMLTGDTDPARARTVREAFLEMAADYMTANTRILPDTADVLAFLKRKGLSLGVVTSKRHARIEEFFRREGLYDLLTLIVGADDVTREKPDPEGLLSAMEAMGVTSAEAVYVGDSLVDAETARRAGCPFIAVTTGGASAEEFPPYHPRAVLSRLKELPALLFPEEFSP
mgnify:CR=1 FL=1